jgi:hypothetical protein
VYHMHGIQSARIAVFRQNWSSAARASPCRHRLNCPPNAGATSSSGSGTYRKDRKGCVKRSRERPRKDVVSLRWCLQPYRGKFAVRNDQRGWRNRQHDLAAICHDLRKSRHDGTRWSKLGARLLHSTSSKWPVNGTQPSYYPPATSPA